MTLDLGIPVPDPVPPRDPGLSADRRRTMRQLDTLRRGYHPVSLFALHQDAPPVDDRSAPGPRCGRCSHLFRKRRDCTWLKCDLNPTAGPATDVRAWWPACTQWAPREEGDS